MADAVFGTGVVEDKEAAIASRRRLISRIVIYGLLGLISIVYIVPFLVVFLNSFRTNAEIGAMGLISLPQSFRLDAWPQAWSDFCIGGQCDGVARYFWNSVAMVIPATIISTALGAINGYILSKWKFPGSEIVFGFMLLGVFMPGQIALLPWAFTLGQLGLSNSVYGLVLVHCIQGLSFTTLFFRNYYEAFPTELIRAAQIDGASFFQIFRRILLPSSGPIIVVTVIWQFTNIWNDFLFGSSFSSVDSIPITVALNNLVNSSTGVKEYNVHFAGAILAALPTLIVYIVSGRYFVRGLMAGAVKG